jgi:lipoate-protein ligase A
LTGCNSPAVILIDNKNNSNPYINAAIEEYLVRRGDASSEDQVMLYINSPCVVVGKNQCIYREVNYQYLRNEGMVIRRLSGGGTVYHDDGNLCFAFFSRFHDRKVNNYRHFNQPIVDALQMAGIDAQFNDRNDITWNGKKISGNAQFTDRKNILSHGTLLVHSDLTKLRVALKENEFTVESKAVASVRSEVMNISDGSDKFMRASDMLAFLCQEMPISGTRFFTDEEWQKINEIARDKFMSHAWIWGRNPATKIIKGKLTIEIDNGLITSITENGIPILTELRGCYYTYPNLGKAIADLATDTKERKNLLKKLF